MELHKDNMFQALMDETNYTTANNFFSYILQEHHFQPDEILDVLPDFYDKLADFLENKIWNIETLKRFADEQFIDYYNMLNRRF